MEGIGKAGEPGAPGGEVLQFDTLPDIARKLTRIAMETGAAEFSLFLVPEAEGRRRLVPCIDSDYPGISETTRFLAMRLGEAFARRVTLSAVPCRWAGRETPPGAVAALSWTDPLPAPDAASAGLALPLSAEGGQCGVLVLTGGRIAASMHGLADIHARSTALFSVIARLRPAGGQGMPSMTRREIECLKLTAEGRTSEEIAARLGLSVHTANQYLANTGRKLNAVNRMQAVAKALRARIIE